MNDFRDNVAFYNQRFNVQLEYLLTDQPSDDLKISIVIPAYNEDLSYVLDSLAECEHKTPQQVEVLIVLNHSENASQEVKEIHSKQFLQYHNSSLNNGLMIRCIRAFDLSSKKAGVGLARKIGMDAALNRFSRVGHDGLLVCLDGDCTVSKNYLAELLKVENLINSGLSIAFEHNIEYNVNQKVSDVIDYELFLRYYVHALRFSNYPHAFHTIGSSMAVRASAYAKIGGMNTRKAGEDFYFLHKLIPHGGFYDLTTVTVYPSSRKSTRVPFGTGRAMLEMEEGTKNFEMLYNPQTFRDLKVVLELNFDQVPESFSAYLHEYSLEKQLADLKLRSKNPEQFRKNFNHWMDGFKVLKYVHFCRDHFYPNVPVLEAFKGLFQGEVASSREILQKLRVMDRTSRFSIFRE